MTRLDELRSNLDVVRRRIADATESAGRTDEVGLVVVTKFFPASDVRILADLGVTDVGENRHQEAEVKAAECADLGLRWHFIGGLQSTIPRGPRMNRRDELAANLEAVRGRIAAACGDAGRATDDVRLVVVTKFFPASDVRLLADLGVTDVGENRHQEAEAKAAECADLGLTWHFIGGLQSNKAAAVAAYADVVESVDRAKLLAPLAKGARQRSHEVDVLLQVSLDPPDRQGRAGADPAELPALAQAVEEAGALRLRGLMAVAPLGEDPRPAFERLAAIHRELMVEHPGATWLSAGMSGDLEQAVHAGATHVRVGSAVLGSRPQFK